MDQHEKDQIIGKLPSDYPLLIWYKINNSLFSPQLVRQVIEGTTFSSIVWETAKELPTESIVLPKTRKIQERLNAKGIDYSNRYVRMVMNGERTNEDILRELRKILRKYQK